MRSILLICAVCLVVFASGCKRSSQQSTNNSAGTGEVSNNLAEDRTRAREQLEKGKELYRNDQDAEAVLAFMEAVRLDPDLAEAHFRLGLGYESLGKREEAEARVQESGRDLQEVSRRERRTMPRLITISGRLTRVWASTARQYASIARRRS